MSKNLDVLSQKDVDFYGDKITGVTAEDGSVYVPIRPICDALGIDRSGQQQRIQRDPVLSDVAQELSVALSSGGVTPPQGRPMQCLPLEYLNGWLFGISANRVKKEVREPLIRYQKDCYKVLAEAFLKNEVTHRPSVDLDELLQDESDPTVVAYKTAMAAANLARNQLLIRSEIQSNTARIELLEARVNSDVVSESQAMQISQAVKAIALELGKRTGRNEFGGVYGELYRRFEITSYKNLAVSKFDESIKFLSDWYASLTGIELPF